MKDLLTKKEVALTANELANLVFDTQKNSIFKIQKRGNEEEIKNQLERFKEALEKNGFEISNHSEEEIYNLAHEIATSIARGEIKKGLY